MILLFVHLCSYIILTMNTDYFENNILECNRDNPRFLQYLSNLKVMFSDALKMAEEGRFDEAKELIMNKYGDFSPDLYKVSSEVNDIFLGQYKEQTIEIYLRFRLIYQELSDESISDLTGYDTEISANRTKLFLMQEIRDIANILT